MISEARSVVLSGAQKVAGGVLSPKIAFSVIVQL